MITKIDKAACRKIVEGSIGHLTTFTEDNDLTVSQKGGAKYDPAGGTVTVTLTFALAGVDPRQVEFNRVCSAFDMEEEDFGAKFKSNGNEFEVCGLKTRAPKFPLLGRKVGTTDIYKFKDSVIEKIIKARKLDAGTISA
jgi:hypothetical protein